MSRKGLNFDEGKLIAECVEAAESTVPASQRLRHIHAVFSDNVDINEQLTLNVTRNKDAKDIASRTVTAKQEGMSIAYCNLLFKETKSSNDSSGASSSNNSPFASTLAAEFSRTISSDSLLQRSSRSDHFDFEIYPAQSAHQDSFPLSTHRVAPSYHHVKVKGKQENDSQNLFRQNLVRIPELPSMTEALRNHCRKNFRTNNLLPLESNIYIHEEHQADQQMLFENDSTISEDGKVFTRGRLWSDDGKLILSADKDSILMQDKK